MSARKAYQPKPIDRMAWAKRLGRVREHSIPMRDDEKVEVALIFRRAFDALTKGECDGDLFAGLVMPVNMAIVLCEMNIGAEYMPDAITARDALFAIDETKTKTGRYISRGPEIEALRKIIEIHEAQMDVVSMAELRAAVEECKQRTGYVGKKAA
ncbi:MAG: hypothetical protein ACRCWJ_09945 [Casimicrobium sp.]